MGSRVPDGDFTNILVSSLPASWDPFTTSYLGSQTGDKVLTSQQFIAIIRNECNRWKSANGDIETMETALTASSSKRTKKRKAVEKEREKRACHICGRDNHLAKDCFFKGKPKCTNCGRFNHKTSKCRSTENGKGKSMTIIDSMTTQNRKHRKVECVQQACDVQEDKQRPTPYSHCRDARVSRCAYTDQCSPELVRATQHSHPHPTRTRALRCTAWCFR